MEFPKGKAENETWSFFFLTRVYQQRWLVIRRVTNERVWEYLHVNEISRTRESGKRGGE